MPAECPGEQSKEDRKKLKLERQAMSKAAPVHTNGAPREEVTELPAMSRSNTMDTLSSGYAASANRSVSGKIPSDEASIDGAGGSQPQPSKPPAGRRNRIVAPPPTQYVSELPTKGSDGSSLATRQSSEPRARMNYTYQATGDGEISVAEGDEVSILEADGE